MVIDLLHEVPNQWGAVMAPPALPKGGAQRFVQAGGMASGADVRQMGQPHWYVRMGPEGHKRPRAAGGVLGGPGTPGFFWGRARNQICWAFVGLQWLEQRSCVGFV